MSGNDLEHAGGQDRRSRRTRTALVDAFAHLVHARRYDDVRVRDILEEADVGRSTFYEHYRGKDDLLLSSMAPLLDALASLAAPAADRAAAARVLEHFVEVGAAARDFFVNPAMAAMQSRIAHELAARIARGLEDERLAARRGAPPLDAVARQAADGLLAWVRIWLVSADRPSAEAFADSVHRSTRASVLALLDESSSRSSPGLRARGGSSR